MRPLVITSAARDAISKDECDLQTWETTQTGGKDNIEFACQAALRSSDRNSFSYSFTSMNTWSLAD